MNVLGSRVDALTLAFRVTLDPAFAEALRERAMVARAHGRASFEWRTRVPEEAGPASRVQRTGGLRARWAEETRGPTEYRREVWGELRYSRAAKVWNIINEPFFRIHVDAQAPGSTDRVDDRTGERTTEGGWTVEIVFYAQWLAEVGLEVALREGEALAALCGEVHEQRLRRIDLCADVAGWVIEEDDVSRLAKRPRAKWAREFGEDLGTEAAAQNFGRGSLDRRTVTGLSVGRGGALMSRIYDKRAELERDENRRGIEEERWTNAGWDGIEPVTRVEFQIRGVAVRELGLLDPEIALECVTAKDGTLEHRILTALDEDGRPRVLGLVDRLDWLWRTCLEWVRLVVLERTKSGRLKPVARLPDDPRWALLREVTFAAVRAPAPIRRFRRRSAASSAQGLGVALSQAGRDGELVAWSESPASYGEPDEALATLTERVRGIKTSEAGRILEWLMDRCGSAAAANVHLAVRANASRLRFKPRKCGGEKETHAAIATGPPNGDGFGTEAASGTRPALRDRGEPASRPLVQSAAWF